MNRLITADTSPVRGPARRPMVALALALVAGLVLGRTWPIAPVWPWSAALVLVGLGVVGLWASRRIHGPQWHAAWIPMVALALLGQGLASRAAMQEQAAAQALAALLGGEPNLPVTVAGRIDEVPVERTAGWEFVIAEPLIQSANGQRVQLRGQRVRVAVRAQQLNDAYFDALREGRNAVAPPSPMFNAHALPLPGQMLRAEGALYPVRAGTTPAAFDTVAYEHSQAIAARVVVREARQLSWESYAAAAQRGMATAVVLTLHDALRAARLWAGAQLDAAYPAATAPLLRALLLGEAERLQDGDREAFRATGLSHLIAVSGFNTGLMLLLILGLARVGGAGPRSAAWIGIIGVVLYAALTGFKPPVARAALMGSFMLVGLGLGRRGCGVAGLATAALTSLLIDPRNLQRVDWQLSYICVLALLIIAPPLGTWLMPRRTPPVPGEPSAPPTWPRRLAYTWLWLPLITTLAVQLALFPVQLHYFRQVNILLPLTNIVGIFLTSFGMVCGVGTLALGWLPLGLDALALPFTLAGSAALDAFSEGLHTVGNWPWTRAALPAFPLVFIALYYGLMLSGRWLREQPGAGRRALNEPRRTSWPLIVHAGGPLLLIAWLPLLPGGQGRWLDWFVLDVKQGDAQVVRLPNGRVLGIDAGRGAPGVDHGRVTVAPFLEALGIGRLDWFVATHADADHIGGAAALLERVPVGALIEGPDTAASATFARLHEAAMVQQVPRIEARLGAEFPDTGGVRVRLLGPIPGMDNNDASVVLLVDYNDVELLLTGDLEQPGEAWLMRQGLLQDVEVLKVAHHGSRGSSTEGFLAATRPELALISVGKNSYGHPADAVLERLNAVESRAFRTDKLGTLWLRTDGRKIELRRYVGK